MSDIVKKIMKDPLDVIGTLTIDDLEKVITYAADKYYNTNNPVVSDNIYDLLVDFLKARDPKSKVLKEIGAKVKSKNKVKLDYWLGSMDKIKPSSGNQLEIWLKKFKKPYYLSDKLDGVSALLIYKKDETIKLYTRGTATEGTDITPLIKYMNLPSTKDVISYMKNKKLQADSNDNLIALRGELIIPTKIFNSNWADKLKNARNSVSGLVNSKTINPDLAKDTDLVIYEIVDPFLKIEDQFKIINELGFKLVKFKKLDQISFESLSEYLLERRTKGEYTVDGIIVTNNEKHDRNTDGNPEYAFAFKDILEDQKAKSTIIEIEWKASKNGYLNPTVLIEPVCVGGVEIKRVTAHNAKFVVENGLGKGAIIEIIRSGDVIPYIQKVIKPVSKPDLPKGKWHWNETEVDIIADDINTDEINIRNIHFFFSSLDTKGLGEKNVEKMFEAGLDTIEKVLNAKEEDLLKVEGFKEKTANNIINAIKESLTNVNLAKLMAASNKLGEGLGERRMKQVLEAYPNLLIDSQKWSKKEFIEKIKELDGWEEKTSSTLVNHFNDFLKFYNKIKGFLTIEKKKEIKMSKLTGTTMVLSGFRDAFIQDKLEGMGVKISSSISKNTNYLIVKDKETIEENTGKVEKAKELGVKIITKNELIKLLEI
jgi:NAD-dependent DNA ligase